MVMKFRAHETFFIRKGWINKGMKYVAIKPDVFIDKDENPMDVLGIGANMVKSLRYWLPTIGLTEEAAKGKRVQTFTDFGKSVYANDAFIEELGTLYLIHYKLVTNKENATAWYYFFNEFALSDFNRDDFAAQIGKYIQMEGDDINVAPRSILEDFVCIINTYVSRLKSNPSKVSAENNIDCPLGQLGLIDILSKEKSNWVYKKATPAARTFNPWVILAVIHDQAGDRDEIGLNELLTTPCNIGRVFNLDSITMLEILHSAERTGDIKIIRTAGLDVIHLNSALTFQDCVDRYYQEINS